MFQPNSVALMGASDREGSLGSVVLHNRKHELLGQAVALLTGARHPEGGQRVLA